MSIGRHFTLCGSATMYFWGGSGVMRNKKKSNTKQQPQSSFLRLRLIKHTNYYCTMYYMYLYTEKEQVQNLVIKNWLKRQLLVFARAPERAPP